ncbi:RluA family pseudouridine synthase [Zavarzinella formosa]|uniref:RluA family pseudouridine synthase n=1 Tax=Zavarzinella formosa TaxID=360055 RepID=UPI0002DBECAC|nr:RluA family pseudouridine synthase [Zavarzinella formosa]
MAAPGRMLPSPTKEGPLLLWLLDVLKPMNRTRVKQLLKFGGVSINGQSVTRHDHPVKPGDKVIVLRGSPPPEETILERAGINIVHQDDALIIIDKPAGLLTVATDSEKHVTAFAILSAQLEAIDAGRPYVVHRLDRDTSGLLVFARSPEAQETLQDNWEEVTKTYLAITEGTPNPAEGLIDTHLAETRDLRMRISPQSEGTKRAITAYKVISTYEKYALLEVELRTGRKHQIRVHLASRGHPVIGDQVYGAKTNPANRLGLHAWKLGFDHPVTGEWLETEVPLPHVLKRIV